jgi:hypothetical protein
MSFMHYQNSTTYFHRVCIQSGIVRKKLGFEARCHIIVIYLNVGYNIAIYLNVGTVGSTEFRTPICMSLKKTI